MDNRSKGWLAGGVVAFVALLALVVFFGRDRAPGVEQAAAATPVVVEADLNAKDVQAARVQDVAKDVLLRCNGDGTCQTKRLQQLTLDEDPAFALNVLDAMSVRNSGVMAASHAIAHEIGFSALERYKVLATSLANCRDNANSGCFHGVMMGYIAEKGIPKAPVLKAACDPVEKDNVLYFECLHGLGHGVMLGRITLAKGPATIGDIKAALGDCDHLKDRFAQESCYGGAFMEYQVAASTPIFHYPVQPKYKKGDLHWPCDEVADKYVPHCYHTQGRYIMDQVGWDYAKSFEICAGAPQLGQYNCASNVGREANSANRANARHFEEVARICDLTKTGEQRAACLGGAVRENIAYNGDVAGALHLCAIAKGEGQDQCIGWAQSDAKWNGWTDERFQEAKQQAGL